MTGSLSEPALALALAALALEALEEALELEEEAIAKPAEAIKPTLVNPMTNPLSVSLNVFI